MQAKISIFILMRVNQFQHLLIKD